MVDSRQHIQEEIGFQATKKRAVKGMAALTGRTFLLQIVSFFGFFLLSVFLNQAEIGLFFAVSELVAILGYFSDIGLAAALIQKKEKPDEREIRSTFTIQEIIVLLSVGTFFILTPVIARFYQIGPAGLWLLRAFLAGFFLASLKTIPSVMLERRLRFDLLVLIEVVETLIFYGLSVFLAWRGFGVISYAWAVLCRGLAGVVMIYLISPWPIGFSFQLRSLKRLLKFGLPFQANTLLAVIKDRLMNVFLWRIIGVSGVGILGWAQKWAQMPLRFAMDPVMKVTFPAFSRLQQDQTRLKKALEFSLFSVAVLAFPLLTGLALMAGPLVRIIPKYQKWETALLPLCLFCFNAAWGAITTPLTNVYNAVGKIKITFKLMILWTVLTWVLTPLLAVKFGFIGAAWALGLIPVSSLIVFYLVYKDFKINVLKTVWPPLLSSLLMGAYLWVVTDRLSFIGWPIIFFLIASGGLVYSLTLFLIARENLLRGVLLLKDSFSSRSEK
ncbi:MAG TPA: oligosaccharide flippase family protein [Candidatus Bathyarchaeia archaeon]|nr:oligosaccharide flippase family protein [Candidatus Bathyarchaeia archaeon]